MTTHHGSVIDVVQVSCKEEQVDAVPGQAEERAATPCYGVLRKQDLRHWGLQLGA